MGLVSRYNCIPNNKILCHILQTVEALTHIKVVVATTSAEEEAIKEISSTRLLIKVP